MTLGSDVRCTHHQAWAIARLLAALARVPPLSAPPEGTTIMAAPTNSPTPYPPKRGRHPHPPEASEANTIQAALHARRLGSHPPAQRPESTPGLTLDSAGHHAALGVTSYHVPPREEVVVVVSNLADDKTVRSKAMAMRAGSR